ncbi:aspartate aminotransferase family protein [Pseudoalteromonas sp. NBT06-2]|uniref:aminotransferase class III-fold pyridoxal phosphate-dependent enzyme n=1 Tax=Pseudoalteromonas sp. NBT06-2 TaxID=2025950 RepID=UPI000BA704F7|nr:aminotransferase class III-fold pyridoxal phosphate-dependent enzyme [Pseudoalteromonas sp. NBT06-2]PAJ72199.1 aspartate aminotransferase family protein [Pseudoalteromonas sp. NBT06-2]
MTQKRYQNSTAQLAATEKLIPYASQTFSKSRYCFPVGAAPLFIDKAEGSQVWDIDGNQYTDFISALLCISLGYKNDAVNQAVIDQLSSGMSFSLPHLLETQVAEKLVNLIPCAQMVRFGKNGTDVTSGAIRLARAFTNKEHVLVCGYHGWQDWYIGSTTRDLGVPEAVKSLTHSFEFNNIASLQNLFKQLQGKVAAVIMEPMNIEFPELGFLESVKQITKDNDALLIFDEIITGFRFNMGGAQSLFNVTPDLATFGKGMANGLPLSALVGKKEIMTKMDDIFFSGTFGGETLSLAAANACIDTMIEQNFISELKVKGDYLLNKLNLLINKHDASHFSYTSGYPAWSFFHLKDYKNYTSNQLRTYFIQQMSKYGILIQSSHNLNHAHTLADIDKLLNCYDLVISELKTHINEQTLEAAFEGLQLEPIFKVR